MSKWGKIKRPEKICVNESDAVQGGYQCATEDLEQFYEDHAAGPFSVERMIFKVALIPDKNLFIILAGSLAGLPINIITGGKSIGDGYLFVAQLISSLLFYVFFLRFVLIVNRVREKGADFDAGPCNKSLIPQAKRNVEFGFCYTERQKIKRRFFLTCIFLVVTIGLVLAGG